MTANYATAPYTLGVENFLSRLSLSKNRRTTSGSMRRQVASAACFASQIEGLSASTASRLIARGVPSQNANVIADEFFRRLAAMVFAVDLHRSPQKLGSPGPSFLIWPETVGVPFLNLLRLSMPDILEVCMDRSIDTFLGEQARMSFEDNNGRCRARLVFICSLLGPDLYDFCATQPVPVLILGLLKWAKGGARDGAKDIAEMTKVGGSQNEFN
jgi:hypothetical protein